MTSLDGPRPTLGPILACDFDGTITVEDVTNLIWDAHVPFDWRAVLMPGSRAGDITPLELIARGYREVTRSREALLQEIAPRVHLRAGFVELVELCRGRDLPLHVVSHGLAFYLRDLLPAGVPFTSFEGTFVDGRWRVTLPPELSLPVGQDFKIVVLDKLRLRHPGRPMFYVGDGRLDFPAARHADRVFAVRGSTLARLCREAAIACVEFDRFNEIADALEIAPPA